MDWTSIVSLGLNLLLGGGIVTLATLKTKVKREEFALIKEELTLERERNKDLIADRAKMRDEYDEMRDKLDAKLDDKTLRLREAQDREFKANRELERTLQENTRLTGELAGVKAELVEKRCEKLSCLDRLPPNHHTRKAMTQKSEK